jgi:hypothetical protein
MSNISNRHIVNRFVSGESKPLAEQRLAKVGYKLTAEMKKNGATPLPSICVSVPELNPQAVLARVNQFLPYLASVIETAQDGIIRSMYESSGGQLQGVNDEDISMDAVLSFLAASEAGTRLSNESIAAWFDSGVADSLYVVIADKIGYSGELTEEQESTLQKHVKAYKGICQILASKGLTLASVSLAQRNAIKVCLKLDTSGSTIAQKLADKLAELEKAPKIEEILELDV